MKNKIRKMIVALKKEKRFLEKMIKYKMNELDFYDYYTYVYERKRTIRYLDMTWEQYDEIKQKIKSLRADYKGSK